MIKNAHGGAEPVGEPPRLLRTIGYKPVDHCIQFASAAIGAIRRPTIRDRAVAAGKQHSAIDAKASRRLSERQQRRIGSSGGELKRADEPMGIAELIGAEPQFLDQWQRQDRELKPASICEASMTSPSSPSPANNWRPRCTPGSRPRRVATLRSSSDRLRW
jgi:hypothetical protein